MKGEHKNLKKYLISVLENDNFEIVELIFSKHNDQIVAVVQTKEFTKKSLINEEKEKA